VKERDHYEDLEVNGRIIFKWINTEIGRGYGIDAFGSG
jgi:hypothetical protein